jgi:hypothetical protein
MTMARRVLIFSICNQGWTIFLIPTKETRTTHSAKASLFHSV